MSRWLISSFSWDTLEACRAAAPEIATAWLVSTVSADRIAAIAEAGHTAVNPWEPNVTEEFVTRCHDAGLAVNTWTCNDPVRLVELAGLGVDGVCTDVPDVALAALGRAGDPAAVSPSWAAVAVERLPERDDELHGIGHVDELEAVRRPECVAVDLIRERRVVLHHQMRDVLANVEVRCRLDTSAAKGARQ